VDARELPYEVKRLTAPARLGATPINSGGKMRVAYAAGTYPNLVLGSAAAWTTSR